MKLRPYQEAALRAFERARDTSCLIVAPTGAGKGTMATELMTRYARLGKKSLFLVHRREIVHDITERLAQRGVRVAQTLYSDRKVRVISVQAALRATILPVDLLVVDEAHHYAADEWAQVVERIKAKRVVGFTATPQRADGRPLGDMFTKIIDTVSYSQLTKLGLLVPARVLRPTLKLGNDLAQDPVEMYLQYARGEQALMFVRRVADADEARDRLRKLGIAAESVHATTPKDKRDAIMRQLEEGTVRVVANVGTLTEGVDVPHVTTCVLARPCAHASTYVQIVGRVLRAAPEKALATVIDLVGASHTHGLPGADLTYSLEGRGLDVREPERRSRSGPSGPHREQEVLGLDLECVHTYAWTAPPAPTPEPVRRKPGRPKKSEQPMRPEGPKRGAGIELRGAWLYYRKHDKARGNARTWALHTQDMQVAEQVAALARAGDWDGFNARRRALKEAAGTKKLAPKSRPAPAARTDGFIFQDRGFWFLRWSEHGLTRRLGLCTKDEAEARKTHRVFVEQGEEAARALVLERKRRGTSLWESRGWWYLTAWNESKTARVKIPLYTRDKTEAEALRGLYIAKKMRAFEQRRAAGVDAARADVSARRSAALKRAHAAAAAAE